MSKVTVQDLINHTKAHFDIPDPLLAGGVFEKVTDEEKEYWAKKRETEASLEEPVITYCLEGNKCICRAK